MITVDIVCPVGGNAGGVENVILNWTKNINGKDVDLRIFHAYKGGAYLKGYEKQYSIDKEFEKADLSYLIKAYETFINGYGAPDICIASIWPMMTTACANVRENLNLDNMKIISWIHSTLSVYEKEGFGGLSDLLNADAHFTINNDIKESILSADPGAKIYDIGNPIEFKEDDNEEAEIDPYMLTYVGRLDAMKNIDIILEAMYRADGNWKLRIIGDGDIREDVKEWIRMLKLEERVSLLGWQEDPWSVCSDSPILVMASDYEGFPMTAIEGSSRGKMLLSTPVNGVKDYIKDGVNGYLFPFGDAQALATILNRLEYGIIEPCDPEKCKESVKDFSSSDYYKKVRFAFGELTEDPALKKDKISVIIPCHNRALTIKECMDSVLSQTMIKWQYEIIAIDDASTDETVSILKSYEEQYPENIMIVELSEHSGGFAGAVRNIGLSYASGKYVSFVDSDDRIEPDMLETMYNRIKESDADVLSSGMRLFSESEGILLENKKEDKVIITENEKELVDLLPSEGKDGTVCGKLFKKEFLDENGIRFPEDRQVAEDTCFSMKCLLLSKKYETMSPVFYNYRRNEGSLWHRKKEPEVLRGCMKTQEDLYPIYLKRIKDYPEVMGWYFFHAAFTVRQGLLEGGDRTDFESMLSEIGDFVRKHTPGYTDNRIILSQTDPEMKAFLDELKNS